MSANNEPAAGTEDKAPDGKVPSQRRVYGTKRLAPVVPTETRPELEEKLANLVDSVKVLQSHIVGGKVAGEPAVEPEPKQRRLKRFQKTATEGPSEAAAEPLLDHEVRGDEATLNKNIAWPRLTRADEALPVRRAAAGRKQPLLVWALAQITGLGLLLLGFLAGQSFSGDDEDHAKESETDSPSKAPVADPLTRVGVNDRALEAAGQGLRAEKTGNFTAARQTWESAVAGQVRLPGADYRLAMLDIQHGDLPAADIHLSNSLAAGEMMASCYFVNACFAGKKGNYTEAAKQLAHAVRIEPYSAKYLFCWGDALRRAGKTQAGITAITQALDRPASASDVELFNFKLRLARIEAGHDQSFDSELTNSLAKAPVTGDWLLLAAARDLNRGAFPAAAGHLRDAAHLLAPEVFNVLVQDFAFQSYATRPEVAALLKVQLPPGSVGPMDPGAWAADEADPAVWPPFAPAL